MDSLSEIWKALLRDVLRLLREDLTRHQKSIAWHPTSVSMHLLGSHNRLFFNTPTAGRGVQLDLYPTCIQAQRTVRASKSHEISNHITQHSAVKISQIRSIQLTNCWTISRWFRCLMGLMVCSDEGFWTAIRTVEHETSSAMA